MKEVKLLNRVDTKFVFTINKLNSLLDKLNETYDVVEINNEVAVSYESLYFDTEKLDSYYQHQRGKGSRYKIRFRNYKSSNLTFLEVKKKHKGRTIKERIKVDRIEKNLSTINMDFISSILGDGIIGLKSVLLIYYDRITIVNKDRSERITLDLNLRFKNNEEEKIVNDIVIAELKQKNFNRSSVFYKAVKKLHIRNVRISKYCTGIILTNKGIKYNTFKEKLLYINKLTNGYINKHITA